MSIHLKINDVAPNFSAINQYNKRVLLSDFLGKKVILYFYPNDDTESCTNQACNFRNNYNTLTQQNFVILGISPNSVVSHQKFIKKYDLPFTLLADEDTNIVQLYGVWGEKKFMGRTYIGLHRTTFIINENSLIIGIIEKVITKKHTEQILQLISTRNFLIN